MKDRCQICANWQSSYLPEEDDDWRGLRPIRILPKTRIDLTTKQFADISGPYGFHYVLQHGIDHCDVNPDQILAQFGTWALTTYGLECLTHYYPIKAARVHEHGWHRHMSHKKWVDMRDFLASLEVARKYHEPLGRRLIQTIPPRVGAHWLKPSATITNSLRFAIFKRDNYRCQICGRSAKDGVQLELDHKVPRIKGGDNSQNNLWTLCFSCNRGKAARDI